MQWDASYIKILHMAAVNLPNAHQIKMEIHFSFFLILTINEYGLIEIFKVILDEKWSNEKFKIWNEPK